MSSRLESAVRCYDSYWRTARFDQQIDVGYVTGFIKNHADYISITMPGSEKRMDWIRDIKSIFMTQDAELGGVGEGFLSGMKEFFLALSIPDNMPVVVEGHSLGAAEALIIVALMAKRNMWTAADKCVVFGCPNVGDEAFNRILANCEIEIILNGADPIDGRPQAIPGSPFKPSRVPTQLFAQPANWIPEGDVAYHHEQGYVLACLLAE